MASVASPQCSPTRVSVASPQCSPTRNGRGLGSRSSSQSSFSCPQRAASKAGTESALAVWTSEVANLKREISELQADKAREAERHASKTVRGRQQQQRQVDEVQQENRRQEMAVKAATRALKVESNEAVAQTRSVQAQIYRVDTTRRLLDTERDNQSQLIESLVLATRKVFDATDELENEHQMRTARIEDLDAQRNGLEVRARRMETEFASVECALKRMASDHQPAQDQLDQLTGDLSRLMLEIELEEHRNVKVISGIEQGVEQLRSGLFEEQQEVHIGAEGRREVYDRTWNMLCEEMAAAKQARSDIFVYAEACDEEIIRLQQTVEQDVETTEQRCRLDIARVESDFAEIKSRAGETMDRCNHRNRELRAEVNERKSELGTVTDERQDLCKSISDLTQQQKDLQAALKKCQKDHEQAAARKVCLARDIEFQNERGQRFRRELDRDATQHATNKTEIQFLESEADAITNRCYVMEDNYRREQEIAESKQQELWVAEERSLTATLETEEEKGGPVCRAAMARAQATVKGLLQKFEQESRAQHDKCCQRERELHSVSQELADLRIAWSSGLDCVAKRIASGGISSKSHEVSRATSVSSQSSSQRWSWNDFDAGMDALRVKTHAVADLQPHERTSVLKSQRLARWAGAGRPQPSTRFSEEVILVDAESVDDLASHRVSETRLHVAASAPTWSWTGPPD